MLKSLVIDPKLCTGCQQCELACSLEHGEGLSPARSRIRVFEYDHGTKMVPYTCTQCAEAWCQKACPVEALVRNPSTGAVEVKEDVCVGCKVCTIACPFGTVNYVQQTHKVAKCDLCGGDPKCAEACPTDAITYRDANWNGLDRMQHFAEIAGKAA